MTGDYVIRISNAVSGAYVCIANADSPEMAVENVTKYVAAAGAKVEIWELPQAVREFEIVPVPLPGMPG